MFSNRNFDNGDKMQIDSRILCHPKKNVQMDESAITNTEENGLLIPRNVAKSRNAARMRRLSYLNQATSSSSKPITSSYEREDSLIKENELSEMSQKIMEYTRRSMDHYALTHVDNLINLDLF